MMFKNHFLLLLLLASSFSFAQKNLNSFIPKGFFVLESASGDLNNDGFDDLIVILKSDVEETSTNEVSRPLLILHGNKNNTYQLVAQNKNVVLCKICGGMLGDPYQGIVIKNNYFSIEHYGGSAWRWSKIITFKFDAKTNQYLLHKDAGESFNAMEPDKTTPIISQKKNWNKLLFMNYTNATN